MRYLFLFLIIFLFIHEKSFAQLEIDKDCECTSTISNYLEYTIVEDPYYELPNINDCGDLTEGCVVYNSHGPTGNSDPIVYSANDISLFNKKTKIHASVEVQITGDIPTIKFDHSITLNNSTLVIEAKNNTVVFSKPILLRNNSHLIVKGKYVRFNIDSGVDSPDVYIRENSTFRVFSDNDIYIKSNDSGNRADFYVGPQEGDRDYDILNDKSYMRFISNDDIIFEKNLKFFRNASKSRFEYYCRGYYIFRANSSVLMSDELTTTDPNYKLHPAHFMPINRTVSYHGVELSLEVAIGSKISLITLADAAISLVWSFIESRNYEPRELNGDPKGPNYCMSPFTVNWDYNYKYDYAPCSPTDCCMNQDGYSSVEFRDEKDYEEQINMFYPNPVRDYLFIKDEYMNRIKKIKIFNQAGELVMDLEKSDLLGSSINISHLNTGAYIFEMIEKDNFILDVIIKI